MSTTAPQQITVSGRPVDPDDFALIVNGHDYRGWLSSTVTAGMESCPRRFELSLTEGAASPDGSTICRPGDPCEVWAGRDRLVTGYIDRYEGTLVPRQHSIRITGRGACQDLIDCAAEWPGQVFSTTSVLDMAQQLAAPFGVQVRGQAGPPVGKPNLPGGTLIPYLVLSLGETPWDIIERVCRIARLLPYEAADGALILAKDPGNLANVSGDMLQASGFEQGVNVLEAAAMLAADQRFSEYKAYRFALDPLLEKGDAGNLIATARDAGVQRYRPRVILMEQGKELGEQNAQDRAGWEAARRWGRGQAVRIVTDSWRDVAGKLYEPGKLAPVNLPTLGVVDVLWLISEVTYRRDAGGTRCELTLMHPQAFGVQPTLPAYQLPPGATNVRAGLGRP